MWHRIFLIVVAFGALLATILGWINYLSGNFSGIAWPFVWMGIFIWGDGIILGTFLFLGSVILWFKKDPIATGLFFSAYVSLRSFIEIIYNLNAQFSTTTRPWETFLPNLASALHLQMTEVHVVAQIGFTAICVFALLVLSFYLRKYFKGN